MSWKGTSVHELRQQFVALFQSGLYSKVDLCAYFNISRPTGDKWLARYVPDDPTWMHDHLRTPLHQPRRTPEPIRERILALRHTHPNWGPRKLRVLLVQADPTIDWPAASTIGQVLQDEALTPPRRARPHFGGQRATPLTAPTAPNHVWCIDFKGWFRVQNGQRCDPLTLTDAHSRFLLTCHACAEPTLAVTRAVLETVFRAHGLPQIIRSDNGTPFSSTAPAGLSTLNIWWIKLGIQPERITPGRPQQNGQHERFHKTLKLEVPVQADLLAQQAAFDAFQHTYNTLRPHEALGQTPPCQHYQSSPRPYPDQLLEIQYPPTMRLRRVRPTGTIKWRGEERFVSECLAGEYVGFQPLDDRLQVLYFADRPLAIWDDHRRKWLARKDARAQFQDLVCRA